MAYVEFVLSAFFAVSLFVVGFILGERQSKTLARNIGDDISERLVETANLMADPNFMGARYNRVTGNIIAIERPDDTTAS